MQKFNHYRKICGGFFNGEENLVMSYYEALADNVRIGRDKLGFQAYYPSCKLCGEEVMSWSYKRNANYRCVACKEDENNTLETLSIDLRKNEKQRKLDTAIKRISKVTDIKNYERAIKCVEKKLGKAGWFQSSEEIMVALELIKRGIKAHHQVKINKYRVDFLLPEEKIVLEVDGSVFHRKDTKSYEHFRDDVITLALGVEWEVIRISTENINKKLTNLYAAIKALKKDRQNKRALNKGLLPKGYSNTAT